MKETAVDYLFQKLWTFPRDKMVWQHYLEKAKQMEKEQMKDAFLDIQFYTPFDAESAFNEYYKELYERK